MPEDPLAEDVPYRAILTAIVKRFVRLVGAPAALNVARKIPQLSVDDDGNVLDYNKDDPLASITTLIDRYGAVFGDIARTLAQQAAQPIVETANDDLWQATGLLASTMAPQIQVLLVDDHVLFREGLSSLLAAQPDVKIVGQTGSMQEAIRMAHALKPMVVLMDITLPDGTGLEATQAILADLPETKIIFLTVHDDDERLFAAIRAGAIGYLFKDVRAVELLERLRSVARGEAGISPAIAARILEEFARTPPRPHAGLSGATELTAREIEIVRELMRGATNREIARKFVISENTVKNHVRSVLSKLHLHSRRDITGYTRDHGLTPPFR